MGLLQGLEFVESTPVGEVCSKAQDQGLIVISASGNVLRFVPPLIVEKEHVDEMIRKLENCLD